ncbi:MAG: hypothetical protein WA975_17860 [Mesorhizobium sp.]
MKMREAPLPPDLQYILDGGVEHGTLTGGAHIAIWLYGEVAEIDHISNMTREERGWASTTAMCCDLESYGQSLIDQTEPAQARAMRGATTASFLKALADHAEWIAGSAFEDAVWGGCSIPYHRVRINRRGVIDKGLSRKLESSAFVKRAVERHRCEVGFRHLMRMWDRIGRTLPPVTPNGFDLLDALLQDQRNRFNQRWAAYHASKVKPIPPKQVRRNRRTTIRAATIAAAILGASSVSAFAKGETISIPAGDITIQVGREGPIHTTGHGALRIKLADAENKHLSGLCLYQDLPALDQLASLALHAQSGSVSDLIAAGNLYNTAASAYSHPLLASKKPKVAAAIDGFFLWRDTHQAKQALIAEFTERRREDFTARVFTVVLGREAGAGLRLWHQIKERAA